MSKSPLLPLTPAAPLGPLPAGAIGVAIDPVALVVQECITVTSAMRKHARWAHSSVSAILGGGATGISSARSAGPGASHRSPRTPLFPPMNENSKSQTASSGASGTETSEHKVTSTPDSLADEVGLAGRWGLRGKKGQSAQDNPLLAAFARLRSNLKRCKNIHTVDAPSILHPFLQVIRSSSTSAPITSLALIAITKFFAYNIISRSSPQLPMAMQLLASAVTHCRFEASEPSSDEIVLFRILKLMEGMVTGPGGDVLGDESMCQMMECGISMCCQPRLSELLRRSAEVSMVTMCQTIFRRLRYVEIDVEEVPLGRISSKGQDEAIKMDPSMNGDNTSGAVSGTNSAAEDSAEVQSSDILDVSQEKDRSSSEVNGSTLAKIASNSAKEDAQEIKPYSLPSIRELFRVLVDILDPHDKQHTDTMRVMALRIVDVGLEVAGPWIASHPTMAVLAKDTLCRHLFQLVRSENVAILNESLRVAGTMLATCRRVLKLQQELFLSYLVACLHPRVEIPAEPNIDPALYEGVPQAPRLVKQAASQASSGRSTPVPIKDRQRLGMEGGMRKPDARETMVESVGALVRIKSFMAELFINYDCEIDRADLCQDMVGLLSRNAFPDAATWSTTNVPPLCLDALLGYVQSIADRLDDEPETDGLPTRAQLREQRARKRVIIKGAAKFNESPRAGIAFLASQGVIDDAENPKSIAKFFRGTTRIDKKVLGDFLTKKNNEPLLTAFMETFDFNGLRVDEALRQLLNTFRLPGEAPLIERIVNEFAAKYIESSSSDQVADKDAIYVLTYAVILLNTDQHNPNVKGQNRMTVTDFSKNLRGVNGGKDFDPEYLQDIYDSIKTQEIILAEEHDNRHAFDHAWKELLVKIQSSNDLTLCDTNLFDADMFAATWKPVIATLTYVFMSATDDTVFSRVVAGFDQCAQIAARYQLYDALDHVVFCLGTISSLATETLPNTSLNTEVQAGGKSVMVSETAVRFGRDFKAQLATVVLFRVVTGHEAAIRDGWTHLTRIVLNLFVNSLVTSSYASLASNADLPPIPIQSPGQVIDRGERSDVGLFSALTSYVSSFANDEPPEPSDQEIEFTLCTVDCIKSCRFEEFFANISEMPLDPLKSFVTMLLGHLPEQSSPRVMSVKPDLPAPTPVRHNGPKARHVGLAYEPTLVFVLEFATILAARDAETIAKMGKEVADALQGVLRDASHAHPVTVSRAVYYLLSFLRASYDFDYIRAPVVLHTISKFDQELVKHAAPLIVKGLALCLQGPPGLRSQMTTSPDFWPVLRTLYAIPEAAPTVFEIVENIATGPPTALTADNYGAVIALLNDFATASGQASVKEQRREQAARKARPSPRNAKNPDTEETASPNASIIVHIKQGIKSTSLIGVVSTRAEGFIEQSQLERAEAWRTYWVPAFRALGAQALNPVRAIRSQALISLQRVLLTPALGIVRVRESNTANGDGDDVQGHPLGKAWTVIFSEVLFPLNTTLLKPETMAIDPASMPDTRVAAAVLICKVFLRYLDALAEVDTLVQLWEAILKVMERILTTDASTTKNNSGNSGANNGNQGNGTNASRGSIDAASGLHGGGESASEAIPESIKNIVLVMATSGYLVLPSQQKDSNADPDSIAAQAVGAANLAALQKRMWEVTAKRAERIAPGIMGESLSSPKTPKTPKPLAAPASPVKEKAAVESEKAPTEGVAVRGKVTEESGDVEGETAETSEETKA